MRLWIALVLMQDCLESDKYRLDFAAVRRAGHCCDTRFWQWILQRFASPLRELAQVADERRSAHEPLGHSGLASVTTLVVHDQSVPAATSG